MNKAQLVEAIADKVGGRQQAGKTRSTRYSTRSSVPLSPERCSVTGFGRWSRRSTAPPGTPATRRRVSASGSRTSVPRFRAGQGFKDLVSGSKKLPKNDVAVKKAPKGSLTGGSSAARTTVKAAAAKKSVAKKATAKKTTAKKAVAPAKKTTATAKKATAKKATATAKKATPAAKKATPAKKATATAKKTAPAKKATAKKAPAKKTTARTTTAKKATARKK
ncbi:hypothetical protein SMICM17S_02526 [Streptomyces microflavus]